MGQKVLVIVHKKIIFRPINSTARFEPSPIPSYQSIPEWFKNIPPEDKSVNSTARNRATVKKCTPFIDALSTGYMFTLPWDLEVTKRNGETFVNWGVTYTQRQLMDIDKPPHRSKGVPAPEGYLAEVWRISLPSTIKTPKGYSVLATHPLNRYDLPFLTMSGIIDTDASNRGQVANMWLKEDFEGTLERGTPVMQIFPFKRENWEKEDAPYDADVADKHEYEVQSMLTRSYQRQFWSKKSYK